MRGYLFILVALALWALPVVANDTGACEKPPDIAETHRPIPEVLPPMLFDDLVSWIARNTIYDLRHTYAHPPTLSFCDVGDIVAYEDDDLYVDESLLAVFDAKARHIYLKQPWTPLRLFDQSILLHELIHDVQTQSHDWACVGAPEPEAYRLQQKWLIEHGIDTPFDWDAIKRLSRCPDRSGPSADGVRNALPVLVPRVQRIAPDLPLPL
jgi:hypothetical protein